MAGTTFTGSFLTRVTMANRRSHFEQIASALLPLAAGVRMSLQVSNAAIATIRCGYGDTLDSALIACRREETLDTLKERPQTANICYAFHREHRLDQAF